MDDNEAACSVRLSILSLEEQQEQAQEPLHMAQLDSHHWKIFGQYDEDLGRRRLLNTVNGKVTVQFTICYFNQTNVQLAVDMFMECVQLLTTPAMETFPWAPRLYDDYHHDQRQHKSCTQDPACTPHACACTLYVINCSPCT